MQGMGWGKCPGLSWAENKGKCKRAVAGTSSWDGKLCPEDKGELMRSSFLATCSPMNPALVQRTRKAQWQHIPQHLPKYPFSPALAAG